MFLDFAKSFMMFNPFYISNVKISTPLILSPMSGVTNSPFRRLIKFLNPGCVGLVVTEFISVEGLTRNSRRSVEMMNHNKDEESPFCIQIFGYDIGRIRDAALMAVDAGADIVDLNCGCPAPKVVRKGGGCELMRHPEHLASILKELRKSLKIPLTIKFRSGWDDESKNALQIALIAESEGCDAIAIHGRTRSALYRGEADWSIVEEVANSVKIPVSGSGDVCTREDAFSKLKNNIKGIYIGRGAIANPFIFDEIINSTNHELANDNQKALFVI